ncbi:small secreted protein [Roridomyces roridus]|uniref:NADH dehydrogenase [ubiquinone] 1 alpha subcomplex subunit 1 n=1 Tax=Roridomyces roridus TaxID=1738132 RepID=A0AAD7C7L3_9AGAR|nr:small secreted protein [Roridomyces roridus]
MPVPWEALIPSALLVTMFGVTGTLANITFRAQNQWKPPRYHLERWDEMMIARDNRLTGHNRGQTSDPVIPSRAASS